jgi:uncharacterized protein (UPF0333 family)
MLKDRKGQAAVELAVLGALVILAFSYLISYSERLNRQQANLMQTFRAALKTANDANSSGSFTKVAHRRMANVTNPFQLGSVEVFSDSASVYWSDGKKDEGASEDEDDPGVNLKQVNDSDPEQQPESEDHSAGDTEVTTDVSTYVTSAESTLTKDNAPGGPVSTTRSLAAEDKLTIGESETDVTTFYLGADGKYYTDQTSLNRSRTWATPQN